MLQWVIARDGEGAIDVGGDVGVCAEEARAGDDVGSTEERGSGEGKELHGGDMQRRSCCKEAKMQAASLSLEVTAIAE